MERAFLGILLIATPATWAQSDIASGQIGRRLWSTVVLDTQCARGRICEGCGADGADENSAPHIDVDWTAGLGVERLLVPGEDLAGQADFVRPDGEASGATGFRSGSEVIDLSQYDRRIVVTLDEVLQARGESSESAHAIAQTLIENVTNEPVVLEVCARAFDAFILWIDDTMVVNSSHCDLFRDTCSAPPLVRVPPGVHTITVVVHSETDPFGFRVGLADRSGELTEDHPDVRFLGPSRGDESIAGGVEVVDATGTRTDFQGKHPGQEFHVPLPARQPRRSRTRRARADPHEVARPARPRDGGPEVGRSMGSISNGNTLEHPRLGWIWMRSRNCTLG